MTHTASGYDLGERLQAALGGGYAVKDELGGGGMSRVFAARDITLNRDIVVKVLPPETRRRAERRAIQARDPVRRVAAAPAHRPGARCR